MQSTFKSKRAEFQKCNMILEEEWEQTKLEKCLGMRKSRVRHPDAPRVGNRKSALTKIEKEMPWNAEAQAT